MMDRPFRTHTEGPDRDREVRIIGVELTTRQPTGVTEEIQMFATERTIPVLGPHQRPVLTITIHTSDGDRTAQVQL